MKKAADAAVLKAAQRLGVRRLPLELRRARKILEVGVPVILAVLAIILSKSSLCTFGSALLSAFVS